jgi:phosphohistidine phosphatase
MRLVIMRHCRAATGAYADADRPLLPAGVEQAESAGRVLLRFGPRPATVLTSPLRRCRETAAHVAGVLQLPESAIHVKDVLAPGSSPRRVLHAVAEHAQADVLAIGHQPDLEMLAAFLLTGRGAARLRLRPGGCACFELAGGAPPAHLDWCLLPEQIELIASAGANG